jgi:phosphate transport system substrate-binding protein
VDNCGPAGEVRFAGPAPLDGALREAAELYTRSCQGTRFTVDAAGTGDAFARLCAGLVELAGGNRPATATDLEPCRRAGVEPVELRFASEGVAIVTDRENDSIECLSFADVYALLGAESTGFRRWDDATDLAADLGSETALPDMELSLVGPPRAGPLSTMLQELVLSVVASEAGVRAGLRADYDGLAETTAIVDALAASGSGLGWLPLSAVSARAARIKALPLQRDQGDDCVAPTAGTIADGTYPASRPLLLQTSGGQGAIRPVAGSFLDYLLADGYPDEPDPAGGYVPLQAVRLAETADLWTNT